MLRAHPVTSLRVRWDRETIRLSVFSPFVNEPNTWFVCSFNSFTVELSVRHYNTREPRQCHCWYSSHPRRCRRPSSSVVVRRRGYHEKLMLVAESSRPRQNIATDRQTNRLADRQADRRWSTGRGGGRAGGWTNERAGGRAGGRADGQSAGIGANAIIL